MSKSTTPPSWMETVMGADSLPESGEAGGFEGPFPHPVPQVKFNQNRKRSLVSEDAENEKYYMRGISFSQDIVKVVPLLMIPRYEVWADNKPVYQHPTRFGPFPDAPEDGRNILRLVYMDADTHNVYAVDFKNDLSIKEAQKLQQKMIEDSANGDSHFSYVYNLFTYQFENANQFGGKPFYPRFQREDDPDPLKKGFKTVRDKGEISYAREKVDKELLKRLSTEMTTDSELAVAVKLNMLNSKQAANAIRGLKSGELTKAQVLEMVPEVDKAK